MQITINITPEELAIFLSEIEKNKTVLNVNDLPQNSHSTQKNYDPFTHTIRDECIRKD